MLKKRAIPWFTFLIALLCVGMFFWQYYLRVIGHLDLETYARLGAPSTFKLYQGQYWGVFWNSFLHSAWQLLLFNLIGLLYLGTFIERRTSFLTLFILGFFASTATSLVQLGLTDNAGIGMTGINYFFLSYIYGRSLKNEKFKMTFLKPLIFIGLGFIALFILTNHQGYTNFGIESMLAGLVLGFTIGLLSTLKKQYLSFGVGSILIIGLSSTLLYAPWSVTWNLTKAYNYYQAENFKNAKIHYKTVLEIEPTNGAATQNLLLIKIEELSDQAYNIHEKGDYLGAHKIYDQIIELDPYNKWAKEQIDKLP